MSKPLKFVVKQNSRERELLITEKMDYKVIPPCKELKDIVSHFWTGTWDNNSLVTNEVYYVIANSLTEFTFAFSGSKRHDQLLFSAVQGHTHIPNQLPVDRFFHLIGVSLYSYAIPSLFNFPSFELNQEFIPLTTFLGSDGAVLNEKIALAGTTEQRITILSNYFKSLLKHQKLNDTRILRAIQEVKKFNGNPKIIDLASDSFLSQKQFNRRFKEFSGFNPKMFARIIRLESAIKSYPNFSTLTQVACSNGYYDQAHFIREFKELTGFSPREFWKLSEDKT
ncbi:MAG: AraC family transcriptional regulator [Bacteroidales bacterium]|nr:AraC family transcriptional regulator [Bacteroidales bacterium]